MDLENLLKEIRTQNWVILMLLGSLSFFFMSHAFTLGLIIGGLIIIANFSLLQHAILGTFHDQGAMKARKATLIAKYYLRFAVMGLIIFILITNGWVNPIGLTIGLSIVVISIINLGIRFIRKTLSREAV